MKIRLLALWDSLRTSYWFLPSLLALSSLGLAWGTLRFDREWPDLAQHFSVFAATPNGARSVLSGVAAAMITIAGLTFSITIVAITVASQQYGARLMRNFMRDVVNQFVLGVFIAIFLYCLLVLGAIRSEEPQGFVPNASVTVSVVFAVLGLGVLIYFIHHVSSSIDVANLVESVGGEIDAQVSTLFPDEIGEDAPEPEASPPSGGHSAVAAVAGGYVQAIDDEVLLATAERHDRVIRLECRPGDLIVPGMAVATVWPAADEALARRINEALLVGGQRTTIQDLEFPIQQLVEIALRALSPGINDPFTAMRCIDRLTISLARLAGRRIPRSQRAAADGTVRVIARPWTFRGALDAAFDQIRQSARTSTAVTARLLEAMAVLAAQTRRAADLTAILRQTALIERGYQATEQDPADRRAVCHRASAVRAARPVDP